MATRTSYDAGTPCWIDLTSPDVAASTSFYAGLFGWSSDDQHDDDGNHIYTNFQHDGQVVAGMATQDPSMAGMPPMWNTYVAVDDVDAVLARVEDAGGAVLLPTMEVMTQGRMAVIADPAGAVVSLWEAGEHIGAQVVNEPDTWAWNELMSRDLEASQAFHADVLGWTYEAMEMPDMVYQVVEGGDQGIAGMMAMPEGLPDQVPSHWVTYFLVKDAAESVARATELGATVTHGPDDTPVGILAGIHDPLGGSFSIMQAPTADDAS